MPGTLDATFGVRTLTKAINTFADDAFDKFFISIFEKGDQYRPEGTSVEWDEVQMHRHLAPVTGHDAPFPKLEETTRLNRSSAMAHVKLYKDIPGRRLFMDRAPGSLSANASEVVARELKDLQLAIMKTVEYMCAQTLLGTLTVNAANIPGSQVVFTINWPVNAYAFANAWNLAGTNILTAEIPAMTADYMQTSGMTPGTALINDNTEAFLRGNTQINQYVVEALSAEALAGGLLDERLLNSMNLGNLVWHKDPGGYVPAGGAFTRFMIDDRVIVLPVEQRYSEVLALALGTGIVPRTAFGGEGSIGIAQAPTPGWYSYATAQENPAGIRLYAGWVGLPILTFPTGVQVATVA